MKKPADPVQGGGLWPAGRGGEYYLVTKAFSTT